LTPYINLSINRCVTFETMPCILNLKSTIAAGEKFEA
jgi:hypothetical protein